MTHGIDRPAQSTIAPEIPTQRPAAETAEVVAPAAPAAEMGDPGMLALPAFVAGTTALGLVNVGFVPATASGASIPIVMTAGGTGLLVAALWAARLGQNANAGVFGIFAGFLYSYAALVLGLTHNWFGVPAASATRTQELFLISWIVVVGMLTLASLRLPTAYVAVFALIELALVLLLIGTVGASSGMVKAAGYVVFLFTALGIYIFMSGFSTATGGRAYPLGRPVIR